MAISSSSPQQLGKRKRGAASDGNKGSSAGGIAKLPKSAGSHSDTKNGKREDVDMGYANGDGSVEDQLVLTVDESTKLQRVVRMLDKHGVATERLPEEAGVETVLHALDPKSQGWPHSLSTLSFYLDLAASASKRRLASAFSDDTTRNAAMSSGSVVLSADATSRQTSKEIDVFVETITDLMDDLKEQCASRLGLQYTPSVPPAYALHRTIGDDMDIFTSAADIPLDDTVLSELVDTDILQVHPTVLEGADKKPSLSSLINEPDSDTPTLKDVQSLLPSRSNRAQPTDFVPRVEPVTFLYYDPYQSFAPTYDSSKATMSYAQSVLVRQSRQSVRDWEKRTLPPLPPIHAVKKEEEGMRGSPRIALSEAASLVTNSLAEGAEVLDPQLVKDALREVEEGRIIDERLRDNTEYLRVLQEGQWNRLRRSEERGQDPSRREAARAPLPAPSLDEEEAARRVLASLTSLLNARPRSESNKLLDGVIPRTQSAYKDITARLVQAFPVGFYGTFDPAQHVAVRDGCMRGE